MKQKSLRQLAKELGVSHSYLSQVKHGKRPASAKVVSKVVSIGKQNVDVRTTTRYNNASAGVAEQADAADLKSAGAILVGSSPTPGTS
jgi:transcriptional regulator with XRE-family HTH domain